MVQASSCYTLSYTTCRNISGPEDEKCGRKILSGQAPADAVLGLDDNENVREYLVDAKGKQKRSPTLVHQAIRKTLRDTPDQFSVLNGGMVIVAKSAIIDDKLRQVILESPSIINGSQTQGELKRHFDKYGSELDFIPSIKFEIIVTGDEDLVAEISIARNFQNDVKAISIAGRRGQLDDLEQALNRKFPDAKLRKSETDLTADNEFFDTEKLIQVLFALLPPELLSRIDPQIDANSKVFTYSQKTRCLKLFQKVVDNGPEEVENFFYDMAADAWELYELWKAHQGFKGTRIRSIEREDGRVIEVPDGVVFPIIAAHTAFITRSASETWAIKRPSSFNDGELIEAAKQAYIEIAEHNPQSMGKSKACYSTLLRITSIYARLSSI